MLRLFAIASVFLAGACQSTGGGSSISRQLNRPDDSIAAFTQACISTNASRESAFSVFNEFNIHQGIPRTARDYHPGGEFVDQEYIEKTGYLKVGARVQGRIRSNPSYCAVRIKGLWLSDAQQPIANALKTGGFELVEKYIPTQQHSFELSDLTAVYQSRGKYFGLLVGQSSTSAGRITDLEFYELATQ